ncbi:HyaD/HybD family hydrogenase maturation endopeptidase [Geobacter benzoatilyticus]|jgi:hydrogenase maturation protease|uniref:HyaD/HybD family hydrogenase maturation endopeptidase n=1 Tax=Geobacter benzoatilyticus TaxID=2815309 RepID=A0ABX7Q2X1_9BACT|nr:HyaD/HybD family hydrogenase maturation endopeptidase [Geobacter benzoatilyticus]QSV45709.1 HyaD/HybD family hydrogenase maturation endopeptidase [Geobacter benzoatilyticus]
MKTLIFGAGNLILSDEGFGVHCIKYLEDNYIFPEEVELFDGGTLGIMVTHKIEEADRVYIVDTVETPGAPGEVFRFEKEDIMLNRLPVKLSPHQIGIQEMLFISEMRGGCPPRVSLLGVIPETLDAGNELSATLGERLPKVARLLVEELKEMGHAVREKGGATLN